VGVQGRTETATLFIYCELVERQYIGVYSASLALGLLSLRLAHRHGTYIIPVRCVGLATLKK
jgi:hypothetical protein